MQKLLEHRDAEAAETVSSAEGLRDLAMQVDWSACLVLVPWCRCATPLHIVAIQGWADIVEAVLARSEFIAMKFTSEGS